jgi:hypothetical protein
MSELDDLTASLDRVSAQLAVIGPDLISVKARTQRLARTVLVCGVVAALVGAGIIAALLINRRTIDTATGDALCPVIRILTSTEPPRTTPAGQAQEARIRAVTQRPDYPC